MDIKKNMKALLDNSEGKLELGIGLLIDVCKRYKLNSIIREVENDFVQLNTLLENGKTTSAVKLVNRLILSMTEDKAIEYRSLMSTLAYKFEVLDLILDDDELDYEGKWESTIIKEGYTVEQLEEATGGSYSASSVIIDILMDRKAASIKHIKKLLGKNAMEIFISNVAAALTMYKVSFLTNIMTLLIGSSDIKVYNNGVGISIKEYVTDLADLLPEKESLDSASTKIIKDFYLFASPGNKGLKNEIVVSASREMPIISYVVEIAVMQIIDPSLKKRMELYSNAIVHGFERHVARYWEDYAITHILTSLKNTLANSVNNITDTAYYGCEHAQLRVSPVIHNGCSYASVVEYQDEYAGYVLMSRDLNMILGVGTISVCLCSFLTLYCNKDSAMYVEVSPDCVVSCGLIYNQMKLEKIDKWDYDFTHFE